MSLTLRITTIASLLTAAVALAASPHHAQARAKLYLCDPGIPASIMCLEGLYTCNSSNPASTCEVIASAAGCGGVDFGEGIVLFQRANSLRRCSPGGRRLCQGVTLTQHSGQVPDQDRTQLGGTTRTGLGRACNVGRVVTPLHFGDHIWQE